MSALNWALILEHADRPAGLVPLLLATPEADRLAFAPALTTAVKALKQDDWWDSPRPGQVVALAAIACQPTAARAATVIGRPGVLDWPGVPIAEFLGIARARQLPWLGDLGLRLAGRIRPSGPERTEWQFVAALLHEAAVRPPVTEGVLRGWLGALHDGGAGLTDRLRDDPWLDDLLPAVFAFDGLASELRREWRAGEGFGSVPMFVPAVARLVAEGRLDRGTVLDATIDRLRHGDKPAYLRTFALLHDELAPTEAEMAGHAVDYGLLLPGAPSPVAGLAQRALRAVDDAGRLDLSILLEASPGVLVRKEKALAQAQLSWLERVAGREPAHAAEIAEAVAAGLWHPSLDVRELARAAIGRLTPATTPDPARPGAAATARPGSSAAGLLGGAVAASLGGAVPVLPAVAGEAVPMPPPIGSPAELAEEIIGLLHEETSVGWERVLAALITFGAGDRAALATGLRPVLPQLSTGFGWTRRVFLGETVRAILDGADAPMAARVRWAAIYDGTDASLIHTPGDVLALRLAEAAERWPAGPVPLVLATPTRVDGSLDAAVLTDRLARAEAEGWEPWPIDFEQALLRVVIDRSALPRAGRLTSSRGRQLAEWLATGGLPAPVSTRFQQKGLAVDRVMANLDPTRSDGPGLVLEAPLTTLSHSPRPQWGSGGGYRRDVLVMTLPHHREVTAAWALPDLAALADQDDRDASLLPMLAEAGGPFGPAMALAVVYGLAARFEADRVAAVDAFLTLAARPEPFAGAVGAELGALGRDAVIKVPRVAAALADAHRAGAAAAVWEVLAAALPILLPVAPRGLPDLLEVATGAAATIRAHAGLPEPAGTGPRAHVELPGLAAVAGRKNGSRLVREARRLSEVLMS
ncbi:hypothetical protein [Actinoplanes sp. HUAS TT8]|uniref:hypothetical protein n=1 Tax=Actinoplanes sp. HUAS TT8 TaxID=3447453 RepID=UPI003F51FA8B